MNQELVDYIKQQVNLNVPKKKITDVLLGQGWQQADLDEAFAAAEGAPVSLKFSNAGPAESQFGDDEGAGGSGTGMSRKKVIAVASVLAALVIVAGVIALPFINKKENPGVDKTAVEQKPAQADNASVTANSGDKNADAATAAAAAERAALASAAKDISGLITAPDGWVARQGIMRARPLAAFFKPAAEKDNAGKDIYTEKLSITRESIKAVGATSADDYIAKSKSALQAAIADYKITAERKVSLSDGSAATLIGGSFTQDGLALRNMQLFAVKGDDAYVVTGVVLAANWDQEKDMIGTAVMSLKIPGQN